MDIYLLLSIVVRMLGLDNVTLIHVLEIDSSDAFRIATYNLLVPDKVSDRVIIPSCKLTLRGRRQHLRAFNIVPVDMMNYTPYIIHRLLCFCRQKQSMFDDRQAQMAMK